MALTPDQQAMLQLLLERGQSYADLADLLGGDEQDVRARARAALAEMGGADPDRNVGLTDYLLGQADPIGRADAVRHLKDDPADLDLATQLTQKLRLLAPNAQLPKLPGQRLAPGEPRPPTGPSRVRIPRPGGSLSSRQSRILVAGASAAVILLVGVLAIAGAFSGGDGGDGGGTTSPRSTSAGCTTDTCGYPITPVVSRDGSFPANGHVRMTIPLSAVQIPIAQQAEFVEITLNDAATLAPQLAAAARSNTPILNNDGKPTLRGKIPRDPNAETAARIDLSATDGSKASGTAVFASTSGQAFVALDVRGLDPPPQGHAYVLWFAFPADSSSS